MRSHYALEQLRAGHAKSRIMWTCGNVGRAGARRIANNLSNRLIGIWLRGEDGRRPFAGTSGHSVLGEGEPIDTGFMNIFMAILAKVFGPAIKRAGPA